MRRALPLLLACTPFLPGLCAAQQTFAVPPPPPALQSASAPARAAAAAPAASSASAAAKPADRPHVRVIEDDEVRIEEVLVRGQARRITVQSKVAGAKAYEIIVPPGGKDPSQDRGAAGQRAWSLFEF